MYQDKMSKKADMSYGSLGEQASFYDLALGTF